MKGVASTLACAVLIISGGVSGFARAQSVYQTIKAFGFPDESSSWPTASVIEGADGLLYGTTENGGSNNLGTIYRVTKAGTGFTVMKSFTGTDGARPAAELLQASDGLFYGTAPSGGVSNRGTIFRLDTNGTYQVLKEFTGPDGAGPRAGLLQAVDGYLYGTTTSGGISNRGTVFRLSREDGNCIVTKSFLGFDGANPMSRLVQGGDGSLFGTTRSGGSSNFGTVFKLQPDGGSYVVLKNFLGANDGVSPYSGLALSSDGVLFGTTRQGGNYGVGTLFKLNPDGTGHIALASFGGGGVDGAYPQVSLTFVSNTLYGVTSLGGIGFGNVYRIKQDGTEFMVLKTFPETGDGSNPQAPLCAASDGFIYGTTPTGGSGQGGTIFRLRADGLDYSIVRAFSAGGNDGTYPRATLIQGSDGMLYGTTWSGGSNNLGTVFKVHPTGSGYTILKSFTPADGMWPYGKLMQTQAGVLFGTTLQGGSGGLGSIFRLNTDGTGFAVVKAFSGVASEGYSPFAGLMQANDGMLYGITQYGGAGGGVIFHLNSDGGGFTVIKSLNDQTRTDGAYSFATLIQGLDGALYGTTAQGGTHFAGTAFKIDLNGNNYTVLRSFTRTNGDGAILHGSLLQTSNGVLYGVTESGGISNCGTIFRINADGSDYQILRRFTGTGGDGRQPFGGLVQRANGLLYGVTTSGGTAGGGTVFQLNPDGTGYAVLHSLTDGGNVGGLFQAADGKLFGGTWGGGPMRYGTIFSLDPAAVLLSLAFTPTGVELRITGIPSRTYMLQRATSIIGPWTSVTNLTPDFSGNVSYEDASPQASSAFYRTLSP